jgi:O-antigen/teichoic acid export membrane protein
VSPEQSGRSFVRSAVSVFGTNLGVAMLSLVNVLVVARALGPTGRGDVALVTTIANLAHYAATFGVNEANVNTGSREPELRPGLATNSVLLSAVFGGLAAGVVVLLVTLVPAAGGHVSRPLLWTAVATIPVLVLGRLLRGVAVSRYGFAVTNLAWIVTPVVNVLVNGTFAAIGLLNVWIAVCSWLGGQILATALLIVSTKRHDGFGRPSTPLARRCLGFGLKSHASNVLLLGNYRADQWLVGSIAGARQLGLYSVAVAWAEVLFYLPTALASVQRPDLARSSPAAAAARARRILRAGLLLTLPIVIGLFLLAPVLVDTIFGASFAPAVAQLRVLTVGSIGVVVLKLLTDALTAEQRPLRATAGIATGFVTMIVLDVALIPPFGGLGASIAASVSYFAGGVAISVLFTRAHEAPASELLPRGSDLPVLWRGLRAQVRR